VLERVIRRSRILFSSPTDTGSSMLYFSNLASVLSNIGGQTAGPIGLLYAMKIGGMRAGVGMHALAAHSYVSAASHIQRRRPNVWTDQAPNWYKHSLGHCAEDSGLACT
jgi:hypothetical protein